MDEEHAEAHADAIAVCQSFLWRLTLLDGAMIDRMDDRDLDGADFDLQHFSSNDVYRTTFTAVVTEAYDARSWRHYTILSQYHRLLHIRAHDDYSLLHAPTEAGFQATLERWGGGRDAVEARWPFEVPRETGADDMERVCRGMWAALRAVAVAGLREEARVGLCEFNVVVDGGVVQRDVVDVAECAAEGVGASTHPGNAVSACTTNSFLFAVLRFYHFVTTHRLFPLLYILIVTTTITPSSIKIYLDIAADPKGTWVLLCTLTTIVYDILEISVLATTLIADATNARTRILYYQLPMMTIFKGIGKLAKAEAKPTVIGEFIGELMLVIARFQAVINSHPTWQLGTEPAAPDSENQLTAEEEVVILGLAWDCCPVRRGSD
ncbi:hypothetical protein Q9L58_009360 [Maublancomyces gigas]|uniref:Uncharacterized protein n=1 Tax=Discina gigas TaxID=1032678 RepID=A0ABR3G740_9PEZI